MKVADALKDVRRLFLDTAPVIYFVEGHPDHLAVLDVVFGRVREGSLTAVTSPITLAESLVAPLQRGLNTLQTAFHDVITSARHTEFRAIDRLQARRAAALRVTYNLTLTDALQVAAAISAGCDALLTNDDGLQRVQELNILVLAELEP